LFVQYYGSDFPSNFAREVVGPVTDLFLLKTPWYVVQLWFEDKLTVLSEAKFYVVGLTGTEVVL
jgi:hypothetical protein